MIILNVQIMCLWRTRNDGTDEQDINPGVTAVLRVELVEFIFPLPYHRRNGWLYHAFGRSWEYIAECVHYCNNNNSNLFFGLPAPDGSIYSTIT